MPRRGSIKTEGCVFTSQWKTWRKTAKIGNPARQNDARYKLKGAQNSALTASRRADS
jgi:hypothetical protein